VTDFPFQRWPEFDRYFEELLELDPGERGDFLDRVCGEDPELRSALETHLRAEERSRAMFADGDLPPWARQRTAAIRSPAVWRRIQEVFDGAMALPEPDRPRFVEEACADEPDVLAEVRSLLESAEGAGEFLQELARGSGLEISSEAVEHLDLTGIRFGAYRAVRPLGRGGSSSVYLAERDDGAFEQRVAVKVLSPSLLPREAKSRFQRERQILAELEHPNIARLLDGGLTDDGWPYIVMEFVDGERIDDYCDRRQLPVRDRLRLFRNVCQAVQYAHRSLVIHRDLKPANILVAPDGTVKLLDFGIAKLLVDSSGAGGAMDTRTGLQPMTPAWASPEQISGSPITTATDVFQLGAVLHLLLTGRHAFEGETGWAGLAARVERDDLPAPSGRVTRPAPTGDRSPSDGDSGQAAPSPAELARLRGTTPWRLRRLLRGDVDTLVLTALRTNPNRRYPTADALDRDVERYLAGEPLEAHPDSLLYRFGKFLGRHPWGSAATVAAASVLTVLSLGLVREYQRAEAERLKAQEVTEFILGLFQRTDPQAASADTLSALALLEDGAAEIERRLNAQPAVRASLQTVLGQAYGGLGRTEEAEAMIRSGLQIRRDVLPTGDLDVGRGLLALGGVQMERRNLSGAEESYREAEEIFRNAGGAGARGRAEALSGLGQTLYVQGDGQAASELYEEAMSTYRLQGLPPTRRYTDLLINLGWLRLAEGRPEEAADLFREAERVRSDLFGPDHFLVGSALTALAAAEIDGERLDSAMVHAQEGLRITLTAVGESHSATASAYTARARAAQRLGQTEEAVADFRRALAIIRGTLGETAPDLARIRNDLGNLLRAQGDLPGSETYLRGAVASYSTSLGSQHLFTGIAWHNLAMTLAAGGDVSGSRDAYWNALRIMDDLDPPQPRRTARTLTALGTLEAETGGFDAADPLLRRALEFWESAEPVDRIQLAATRAQLGRTLWARDRATEAEPLLLDAHAAMREIGTDGHPVTRRVAGWVADLYDTLGRTGEAEHFRTLAAGG
jgi:serine/threonine-protein kinase